ncbi:unnamed protein product [Tetraodon nigroviridis]|uniref:Chromosome 5 SCAF14581, whole genome shotgun sequence n=1 Tax=Tetraodon nigroviridis TaxID=99883 RepID=Q4SI63_TETNG|nr:unnamed protein product [Tetraodon nigroviridis]
MNAEICISYSDMTSMDSYYGHSAVQRDQQADHFRTFPAPDTKYGPTAFLPNKGQAYGEKPRSPFQQECPSLDAAAAGQGTFSKYHLFMQRSLTARHPRRRANCSRTADTAARSSPVTVSVEEKERNLEKFSDSAGKVGRVQEKKGFSRFLCHHCHLQLKTFNSSPFT